MKRKLYSLLFILLIFPVVAFAQSLDEKLKEIDAYAEKTRAEWNLPGMAIAIVKDDKVIFAKGYGVRELNKPEKVDENTLFAVASNSKAFTTASLAILVDEGKIKWDDKVSKYLTDFQMYDPYVTSEITIRDIVSHRSGLGTFSGDLLWYETDYPTDEILRRVRFLKPVTGFRAGYGYQNLMFIAAGKIVEKVSGKPWAEFVRERILTPLGMTGTKTSVNDFKPGDNIAMPHNESGGKGMRVIGLDKVDSAAGAVRINSSVSDMAKWLRLQLGRGKFEGRQIFSERQSWTMWQPNIMSPISDASMKNNPSRHFSGYGMGWFLADYQGRKVISHSGGLDGMISQTAMMPEENLGIIVLTNADDSPSGGMVNKIFDVMLGIAPKRDWAGETLARIKQGNQAAEEEDKKIVAARAPNTKPTLALENYGGTYTAPLYGDATITSENGKLVLRFVHSPNLVADLEHWHYDTFQIHWRPSVSYNFPRGFVTFTIDKNGKTDQMQVDQPNSDFWFYELEFRRSK